MSWITNHATFALVAFLTHIAHASSESALARHSRISGQSRYSIASDIASFTFRALRSLDAGVASFTLVAVRCLQTVASGQSRSTAWAIDNVSRLTLIATQTRSSQLARITSLTLDTRWSVLAADTFRTFEAFVTDLAVETTVTFHSFLTHQNGAAGITTLTSESRQSGHTIRPWHSIDTRIASRSMVTDYTIVAFVALRSLYAHAGQTRRTIHTSHSIRTFVALKTFLAFRTPIARFTDGSFIAK